MCSNYNNAANACRREQRAILGKDLTTKSLVDSAALRGSRVKMLLTVTVNDYMLRENAVLS